RGIEARWIDDRSGPRDLDPDSELAGELRQNLLRFHLAPDVGTAVARLRLDRRGLSNVRGASGGGIDGQAAHVDQLSDSHRRSSATHTLGRFYRVAAVLLEAAGRLCRQVDHRLDTMKSGFRDLPSEVRLHVVDTRDVVPWRRFAPGDDANADALAREGPDQLRPEESGPTRDCDARRHRRQRRAPPRFREALGNLLAHGDGLDDVMRGERGRFLPMNRAVERLEDLSEAWIAGLRAHEATRQRPRRSCGELARDPVGIERLVDERRAWTDRVLDGACDAVRGEGTVRGREARW